ncbi:unnamed protein product [Boreogadus saida]
MHRRLSEIRRQVNANFDRAMDRSTEEATDGLVDRFALFRREEGAGPTRSSRRRRPRRTSLLVKVSVLKQDIAVYRCTQEILVTCPVILQDTMSREEFLQALRDKVPNMPEAFDLCRLIGRRFTVLTDVCPRDLRGRGMMGLLGPLHTNTPPSFCPQVSAWDCGTPWEPPSHVDCTRCQDVGLWHSLGASESHVIRLIVLRKCSEVVTVKLNKRLRES